MRLARLVPRLAGLSPVSGILASGPGGRQRKSGGGDSGRAPRPARLSASSSRGACSAAHIATTAGDTSSRRDCGSCWRRLKATISRVLHWICRSLFQQKQGTTSGALVSRLPLLVVRGCAQWYTTFCLILVKHEGSARDGLSGQALGCRATLLDGAQLLYSPDVDARERHAKSQAQRTPTPPCGLDVRGESARWPEVVSAGVRS
jgi:hypothetical protein